MAESESGGAPLMTSTHSVQSAAAATPQASPRAPGPALKGPGCPASMTAEHRPAGAPHRGESPGTEQNRDSGDEKDEVI